MQLRDLLLTLLLFSGIIIGLTTFMGDLANKYSNNIQDLSELSSVQKIQEEAKKLEESLRSAQITGTFLDIPLTVLSGAYQLFKLIITSFTQIWSGFINNIASYLFLPTWFIAIIIASVVIFILFEIISAIMKYKV